ncbi:MAG: glycosyltransferase [Bacteroidota bacterium]
MTTVAGGLLLALGAVYAWTLLRWSLGFRRVVAETDSRPLLSDAALPTLTVVIPARDEEATIGSCVDSVLATDYPEDKLEVIVVDDDSSDRTAAIVRGRIAQQLHPAPVLELAGVHEDRQLDGLGTPQEPTEQTERPSRLRLIQIPENRRRARAHKKAAIEKAVSHASGEIILTTDADCQVPRLWPRALASAFDTPEVAFVSGPVRYDLGHRPTLFARLQAMDFFGLMACGAGGIGIGRPNLANGASVAYRRATFEALGGFSGIDHVTSGDDELLMQKIAYGTDLTVRFCAAPDAVVLTEPVHSLRQFVHQRKRWASKGTNYPPRLQRMLLGVVGFFAALVLTGLATPFVPALAPYLVAAIGLKALSDLTVLGPAARRFKQMSLLRVYPLHLLLHAPHSLLVGLLGPIGGFEWKTRHVDR